MKRSLEPLALHHYLIQCILGETLYVVKIALTGIMRDNNWVGSPLKRLDAGRSLRQTPLTPSKHSQMHVESKILIWLIVQYFKSDNMCSLEGNLEFEGNWIFWKNHLKLHSSQYWTIFCAVSRFQLQLMLLPCIFYRSNDLIHGCN